MNHIPWDFPRGQIDLGGGARLDCGPAELAGGLWCRWFLDVQHWGPGGSFCLLIGRKFQGIGATIQLNGSALAGFCVHAIRVHECLPPPRGNVRIPKQTHMVAPINADVVLHYSGTIYIAPIIAVVGESYIVMKLSAIISEGDYNSMQ